MSKNTKKGYVLVFAIILAIILAVASISLFFSVGHVVSETKIRQTKYVRGYYWDLAGLRYAGILLRNPEANLGFTNSGIIESFSTNDLSAGSPAVLPFNVFCADLGIDSDNYEITVTEQNPSGGPYEITASYEY